MATNKFTQTKNHHHQNELIKPVTLQTQYKIRYQDIYANRRQSPTHKANAGGGMRRCNRWAK